MDLDEDDGVIHPRKPKELARKCPTSVFLSGHDGGGYGKTYWPWPYRIDRVGEANSTYVADSDQFILDSAISDDDVETEDVIEEALQYEPDLVIPADVLWEPEETTERVLEFLDAMDDAGVEAEPIIPLQPTAEGMADHHQHYRELEGLADRYAIGGVKDADPSIQRDGVEAVREIAPDVHLHGLGFGIGYYRDPRTRRDPLLDSIDSNSPIVNGRHGRHWQFHDGKLIEMDHPKPEGQFALLQVAVASGLTLIAICRIILNDADPDPEDIPGDGDPVTNTELGDWM